MEIFPNFASQFIDLLNRFQSWLEGNSVALRCLSRVTDHILQLVKTSDVLGKLSDIDFESFHSQDGVHASLSNIAQRAR
jgi:hypothetical protein